MDSRSSIRQRAFWRIVISCLFFATRMFAADIRGQVLGAGVPIAESTRDVIGGERRGAETTCADEDRQRWQVRDPGRGRAGHQPLSRRYRRRVCGQSRSR